MLIKKKKSFLMFIMLAASCMFLTACDSKEQKEQNSKWEAQASENAQAYIKEKYGFSADIIDAKVDRRQGMFGTTPLSDVLVQMQYDDHDFTVFITGEKESTEGADTYQAPEIKQALFETVNREISGLQVLDIYPKFKSERQMDEPLYSAYFDGSNLSELIEDGVDSFEAFYVKTDLSSEKDFSWLEDYKTTAKFISCRKGEILKTDEQTRSFAACHPVYCDNSRDVFYDNNEQKIQTSYNAYDLKKYSDFYYYVNNQYKYEEGEPSEKMPKFSKVVRPEPNEFNGKGAMNASVISKAYTISADSPMYVHVYYPKSALNTDKDIKTYQNDFDCGIITEDHNNNRKCEANPLTIVGDYVYESIYVNEENLITFVILSEP